MIHLKTSWSYGAEQQALEPVLFELLRGIARSQSLQQAADELSLSYRHAWGLLKRYQELLGQPLTVMHRGRAANSQLTDFAKRLVQAEAEVQKELAEALHQQQAYLNQQLGFEASPGSRQLTCYASHDLVVNRLISLWNDQSKTTIELHTHGSLDALKHYAAGDCDIAGFHSVLAPASTKTPTEFDQLLNKRKSNLIPLVRRAQGLMFRQGNPKKIQRLHDLTKRSVRFVNRQAESGTRLLFDQLLHIEDINSQQIRGYHHEEFTHSAVAALVASGQADVGMGIQAVTPALNLDFIPLIVEEYYLALAADIEPSLREALQALIKSPTLKSYIDQLEGYELFSESTQ